MYSGCGDEIRLDEEAAIKLYQDLADTLDLPCQRTMIETSARYDLESLGIEPDAIPVDLDAFTG
jgi:hypothetical protein